MQNKEVAEFFMKKVRYSVFKPDGSELSGAQSKNSYQVLWFDPKMKNYEMFVEHLIQKRLVHANIELVLVVDKPEHMIGVLSVWSTKKTQKEGGKY